MINTLESIAATHSIGEEQRIEHLFNIIEIGLIDRMAKQDAPLFLVNAVVNPVTTEPVIPLLVNALWTLYHESACAINQKNRTTWNRFRAFPGKPIEPAQLVEALVELLDLVRLDVLSQFRDVLDDEKAAYEVLTALAGYYKIKHSL